MDRTRGILERNEGVSSGDLFLPARNPAGPVGAGDTVGGLVHIEGSIPPRQVPSEIRTKECRNRTPSKHRIRPVDR